MVSMVEAMRRARGELESITGSKVERVCGFEPVEDGWEMQVEVVEVVRTPNTQDLLALYEVQVGSDGALMGFDRVAHRTRGGGFPQEQ